MCCDAPAAALLPPPIVAMLDEYRALNAERANDWGDEAEGLARGLTFVRWLGPQLFMVFAGQDRNWRAAVRRCLIDPLPTGLIVASVGANGIKVRTGPQPYAIPGGTVQAAVVLDSKLRKTTQIEVDGSRILMEAGGIDLIPLNLSGTRTISVGSATTTVGASAARARLRLMANGPSRWSVTDDHGGAWFPDGQIQKWDFHGRSMFHGNDLLVDVPAVPLSITCGRGMEFDTATTTIAPEANGTTEIELEPPRLYEPASHGWYGGDLHVHMNYSGDNVCSPHDAACMQLGEGLHLMNLVAANISHTRVYDQEAFELTVGHDLRWTTGERVARFGVEYRNDLLGHFHALGPSGPPSQYSSGHPESDHAVDWPPNAVACEEFQGLGATVGYAHPIFAPLTDGSPAAAFTFPRSMDARELVADAALGLVDSLDLIGPNDVESTAVLYHHLLNSGLRLAATAGTDVWLSYSRGPLLSNPPGWARVYADLRGAPLSVAAFQDAIRAGRTLATNGPWLELTVDGRGPGDVLEAKPGQALSISVRCQGLGVERLELVGPDGVVARSEPGKTEAAAIETTVAAVDSMWLCAVARGPQHPSVPGPVVFAHTSPVYLEVGGRPMARPASARWLLDWLDRLENMVRTHGQFDNDAQRGELLAVINRARPHYRARATGGTRAGKNQWVVRHGDGWAQRGEGNQRVTRIFERQTDAIAAARETARRERSELIIQGEDGQIRERSRYGNASDRHAE